MCGYYAGIHINRAHCSEMNSKFGEKEDFVNSNFYGKDYNLTSLQGR